MNSLCLGGSFNPVHFGHLICARHAAEQLGFDSVTLIPSAQPPHKTAAPDLAPVKDRVALCKLAVEGYNYFKVDDLETHRAGPSYTIDTARELRHRGWPRVSWIIGADMVAGLPRWHKAEALLREVEFVILARPGWCFKWDDLPMAYQGLRSRVVVAPMIEISATMIRQRVADGLSIDCLTPDAVVRHICATGLYRHRV
jgi:nicotinate-nucleotide adenylyltransferase